MDFIVEFKIHPSQISIFTRSNGLMALRLLLWCKSESCDWHLVYSVDLCWTEFTQDVPIWGQRWWLNSRLLAREKFPGRENVFERFHSWLHLRGIILCDKGISWIHSNDQETRRLKTIAGKQECRRSEWVFRITQRHAKLHLKPNVD